MAAALLSWYAENRRILPWREAPTPYHVWLSEIMLQQTRVEAVRGYYARFLQALPDIPALAAAEEDVCLKLWEGLGYYSRVRNLRAAAQFVVREYGGALPGTEKELLRLPGIGRYTAAAIAAIAFGRKAAAVDGNLLRIYARMTFDTQNIRTPQALAAAERYFLDLMEELPPETAVCGWRDAEIAADDALPASVSKQGGGCRAADGVPRPFNACGNFNQALMDLGATVCLPNAAPRCGICPWRAACRAHALGRETEVPVIPAKKPRQIEELTVFVIQDAGRTALRKRPARGLLAGLYELPNTSGHLDERQALGYVRALGCEPLHIRALGEAKHIFTHKEWHMTGYAVRVDELAGQPGAAEQPSAVKRSAAEAGAGAASLPRHGELLLADTAQIERQYSIPSAFSAYTRFL